LASASASRSRHLHVVVRVGKRRGGNLDQVGTSEPDHVLLFLALGVRHHDHGAVAQRIADQRQADAGIARRALDNHPSGLEQAAGLGVADDRQRGTVLDRLAGVHELGLAEDAATGRR
jgi:hypothetical protein